MLEKIFPFFLIIIPLEGFPLERGDISSIRYERLKTSSIESEIEVNDDLLAYEELVRLKYSYPNAIRAVDKIEPFSYFGFKLEDVNNGKISYEDFLKELEKYIKTFKRTKRIKK